MKKDIIIGLTCIVTAIVMIIGCEKVNNIESSQDLETIDATLYYENDRYLTSFRSQEEVDSIQAIIDSLTEVINQLIEERDSIAAELGEDFYSYSSKFDFDFERWGAESINKVMITSATSGNRTEFIVDGTSPWSFANAVRTVIINERNFEGNASAFSSSFEGRGTVIDFDLYVHVSGIDNVFSAPRLYMDIEFTGDARYDIRLLINPQVGALNVSTAGDDYFDDLLEVVKSTKGLNSVSFSYSVLSEEEIIQIADEVLKKEVFGNNCFWIDTNLPDSYEELFLDKGWLNVRL